MPVRVCLFALALACLAILGCGRSANEPIKAGGTVTYRNQPLANVSVLFVPEHGRTARGTTDAAGQFTLTTLQPGDGAFPGRSNVSISPAVASISNGRHKVPQGAALTARKTIAARDVGNKTFPPKYSNPETSRLSADVKVDGPNDFHFDLSD